MATNPKIAGFQPIFRAFRGFSCLFDGPAGSRGAAELYTLLYETLQKLDSAAMTTTYLFCPLPFSSYHITVWDGVNDGNLEAIAPAHRDYFRSYLGQITSSLKLKPPFGAWIANSPLIMENNWGLKFKFKKLTLWGGGPVLVAQLEAADETSKARLQKLEAERKALYDFFEPELGISMYRNYTPHISLGYFANKEGALKATAHLEDWNAMFEEALAGATIRFDGISLHGFDSMANFFNEPPQPGMRYSAGDTHSLPTIQRLMGQHDFYRTLSDFYGGQLNEQAIEKMKKGTYAPAPGKMEKHEESHYTSLIIRLSEAEGAPLFQPIRAAYDEAIALIREYYPALHLEPSLDSAHLTIRSIVNHKKQSLAKLEQYRAILHPGIQKWLERFSADTVLYVRGLHISLNSFKGLSIGVKVYPSTPIIQMLRGVAGVELYNALDEGRLDVESLWEEAKAAEWHTRLTHISGLRVRDPEFLPPWAPGPIPEREKAFIHAFEALVEKYDNVVFGKISNIQLGNLFIRNGKSDKLKVGKEGGVELSMEGTVFGKSSK